MKNVLYGGSFDPFTNGHLYVVTRACAIFDEVVVAVANNPDKRYLFTEEERCRLVEASIPSEIKSKVKVVLCGGRPLTKVAEENGAETIIRGLRDDADFTYENTLGEIYRSMSGHRVQMLYVMCPPSLRAVSSGAVRELDKLCATSDSDQSVVETLRRFVPEAVFNELFWRRQGQKA